MEQPQQNMFNNPHGYYATPDNQFGGHDANGGFDLSGW
jgi:hypothetical protein